MLRHGQQYLAECPNYGLASEAGWARARYTWAITSHRSTVRVAKNSGWWGHAGQ
ncbi:MULTISPECIES: hypothetical protein [Streptomyces]|uniref:Uncharacterized protein n=1 Tax=Streptomyces griseoaurantiacus M045 TaxID=996637 RepID=F3NDY4_9ACTN|nr:MULTISPECIES: hypothetical protein [Streptomyces]EGG48412.1 hypothetical protein SGM_1348 [Streptomyces griseoaurantiacus M045]